MNRTKLIVSSVEAAKKQIEAELAVLSSIQKRIEKANWNDSHFDLLDNIRDAQSVGYRVLNK